MASITSLDRHKKAIDKIDLKKKDTPFHKQLDKKPEGWKYSNRGNVQYDRKHGYTQRNDESVEDRNDRAKSMQRRAQGNWKLANNMQKAKGAFSTHGREREENRDDASVFSPMDYGRQMMTGKKPLSPRSQKANQVSSNAVTSANAKSTFRAQDHVTAAVLRREKFKKEKETENRKTKDLENRLKETPGYYHGSVKDIFWAKQYDYEKARGLSNHKARIQADRKYYIQYPEELPAVRDVKPKASKTSKKTTMSPLVFSAEFNDYTGHPDYIIDPISREPMVDPVVLENGMSYERESITEWFFPKNRGIHSGSNLDPMTNEKLKSKKMAPNMSLRHAIMEYYNNWTKEQNLHKDTDKKQGGRKKTRKKRKKTRRKNKVRGKNTRGKRRVNLY